MMQKVKNKLSLLFMFSNILKKFYVNYFHQSVSLFRRIFGNLFCPYTCHERRGLAQAPSIKTTPRPSDTKIQFYLSEGQHAGACAKPAVGRKVLFSR